MRLLFLHGAGAQVEDRPLADALGEAVGAEVSMPLLPEEDMSYAAWGAAVRRALAAADRDDLLVAHSFGASVLLRVLGERSPAGRGQPPARAVLLAMPDWGVDGWGVEDYAYDGPEPTTGLSLHHCEDDEVVPHTHLALHAARLPSARTTLHPRGGHQFEGLAGVLAEDLRRTEAGSGP